MQIRDQQRSTGAPATSKPGGAGHAITRDRRATVPLAITAVVVGVTLVIAILVILSRGGSALRGASRPAADALAGGRSAEVRSQGLQMAARWVDGLAAGLVLPSDVTSRLAVQDPKLAKVVMTAWSDLSTLPRPTRIQTAARWVDGLAAGLLLPSDVTSRLAVQDPKLTKAVKATWSDLNRLKVG